VWGVGCGVWGVGLALLGRKAPQQRHALRQERAERDSQRVALLLRHVRSHIYTGLRPPLCSSRVTLLLLLLHAVSSLRPCCPGGRHPSRLRPGPLPIIQHVRSHIHARPLCSSRGGGGDGVPDRDARGGGIVALLLLAAVCQPLSRNHCLCFRPVLQLAKGGGNLPVAAPAAVEMAADVLSVACDLRLGSEFKACY